MATSYIGKPPTKWVIPVTRGCDRSFAVRRRDDAGAAEDWNAQVYIDIDIDRAAPTRVHSEVNGDEAVFTIDSSVCDAVKSSTRWRIVMSDSNDFETPLAVGTFERHDG